MSANPLNAVNRGVYVSDNLPFLQSLNDGCVDLVCIDPPFAKNETFGRKNARAPDPLKPPLLDDEKATELALLRRWGIRNEQDAAKAGIDWPETRYRDIWSWETDVHEQWLIDIENDHPAVAKLIDVTREIHSDGTAAYLCYMAVRLFEIHRVLKDTGSLYLHCDHTANAYLRQLLDAVFGKQNIIDEIVWHYGTASGGRSSGRKPVNCHDTIFAYAKDYGQHIYNRQFTPYSDKYVTERFLHTDENGRRYQTRKRANGVVARQYLDESPGVPLSTVWNDIKQLYAHHLVWRKIEETGYPTQKPVALAQRIIKASCPEGGVVLDCFAGCAYVAVAAEREGRDWLACDINPRAWTVFKRQFSKPKLASLTCAEPTHNAQPALIGNIVTVHGPDELPKDPIRTEPAPAVLPAPKPRGWRKPASIIPPQQMLEFLLDLSDYTAWCCGFANRMPDGAVVRTTNNFHLDHLDPKSKDGSDQIFNRAPLCPYHNIHKNSRRVHLDDYRAEIAAAGELLVKSTDELVNLAWAQTQVMDYWAKERAKYPFQQDFSGRIAPVPPGRKTA